MYGPCNIAVSGFVLIRWTQFVSLFRFKLMMMICQDRLIKKFHFSQFLNKSQILYIFEKSDLVQT